MTLPEVKKQRGNRRRRYARCFLPQCVGILWFDRELQAVFITKDNVSTQNAPASFWTKARKAVSQSTQPAKACLQMLFLAKPFFDEIPLFSQSAIQHLSPPLTE